MYCDAKYLNTTKLYHNSLGFRDWCGSLMMAVNCWNVQELNYIYILVCVQVVGCINCSTHVSALTLIVQYKSDECAQIYIPSAVLGNQFLHNMNKTFHLHVSLQQNHIFISSKLDHSQVTNIKFQGLFNTIPP